MKRNTIVGVLILIIIMINIILFIFKIVVDNREPIAYCSSGYELRNNICIKEVVIDAIEKEFCDEGYTLENDICTKVDIKSPIKNYYCLDTKELTEQYGSEITASDSKLVGTNCLFTFYHKPIEKKECPEPFFPVNDDYCLFTMEIDASYNQTMNIYLCPSSASLQGTKCVHYFKKPYEIKQYCGESFTLKNGMCESQETYTADYKTTCPTGYNYNNDNTCTKKINKDVLYEYKCPEGYDLENKKCKKISIEDIKYK